MTAPLDASPEIKAMVELERLAKAATPGPWRAMHLPGMPADCIDYGVCGPRREVARVWTEDDTHYLSAANPETILKLLALLRRLGEREARMREAEQAMRRAQILGPNTVSVDGENGPFDSNAARLKIWFRSWDDALAVVALAAGKEGE